MLYTKMYKNITKKRKERQHVNISIGFDILTICKSEIMLQLFTFPKDRKQAEEFTLFNSTNSVRTSKVSGATYRTINDIHFSLEMSDVSSINTENLEFCKTSLRRSVSRGHRTFDIILEHLVRPHVIRSKTSGSFPTSWKNWRIAVAD